MTTYTISKSFKTSVERSPRVLEVAEAFGLGLSDKEFHIFRNLEVEVRQGDVVYITGQSGSGKSQLLKLLGEQMRAEGRRVADLNEIALSDLCKPIVDLVGKTMTDAVGLLSRAGINDAYLLCRKPSELSDGQRYRLKLAMLIESDADVWIADEFGAVLDRVTAKVVALNMQKIARAMGKTLLIATTHTDLAEELGPDLIVSKRYADRVELTRKEAA